MPDAEAQPDLHTLRKEFKKKFVEPQSSDDDTKTYFSSQLTRLSPQAKKELVSQHCDDRAAHIAERLNRTLLKDNDRKPAVRLGAGGYGIVYKVKSDFRESADALKLLQFNHIEDPGVVERFRHEYRVLKEFEHLALPRLLHAGEVKGQPFYLMELCGENLDVESPDRRELLAGGAAAIARFAMSLFDLLAIVHGANRSNEFLAHRDIKPKNILVHRLAKQGVVPKLIDFGILQVRDPVKDNLTPPAELVEPRCKYTDPDFAKYGGRDARLNDVFSLGKVLQDDLLGRLEITTDAAELQLRERLGKLAVRCQEPWRDGDAWARPSAAEVCESLVAILNPPPPSPPPPAEPPPPKDTPQPQLKQPSWLANTRVGRNVVRHPKAALATLVAVLLIWAFTSTWLASARKARANYYAAAVAFQSGPNDATANTLLKATENWGDYSLDDAATLELASSYQKLGEYCREKGDIKTARLRFERAIVLLTPLVEKHRDQNNYLIALGLAYGCLGDVNLTEGSITESHKSYEKSLELRSKALAQARNDKHLAVDVALANSNFARLDFYYPESISNSRDTWAKIVGQLNPIFNSQDASVSIRVKSRAGSDLAASLLDHCCGAIASELEECKEAGKEIPANRERARTYLNQAYAALQQLDNQPNRDVAMLRLEYRMWYCLLREKRKDEALAALVREDSWDSVLKSTKDYIDNYRDVPATRWVKSLYVEIVMRMPSPSEAAIAQARHYIAELTTGQDFFMLKQQQRFETRRPATK